jgi:hypothetical protein
LKRSHTLKGGVDVRRALRDRTGGGNRSGQLTFDRTYTRQYSDETTLTPSNLGLSMAAFLLGLPTSASITDDTAVSFSNNYVGAFGQDTWRLGKFTLNTGLRYEYETDIREKNGRMIVGFDPDAQLAITGLAQQAYLASGLQNTPGMPASLSRFRRNRRYRPRIARYSWAFMRGAAVHAGSLATLPDWTSSTAFVNTSDPWAPLILSITLMPPSRCIRPTRKVGVLLMPKRWASA